MFWATTRPKSHNGKNSFRATLKAFNACTEFYAKCSILQINWFCPNCARRPPAKRSVRSFRLQELEIRICVQPNFPIIILILLNGFHEHVIASAREVDSRLDVAFYWVHSDRVLLFVLYWIYFYRRVLCPLWGEAWSPRWNLRRKNAIFVALKHRNFLWRLTGIICSVCFGWKNKRKNNFLDFIGYWNTLQGCSGLDFYCFGAQTNNYQAVNNHLAIANAFKEH